MTEVAGNPTPEWAAAVLEEIRALRAEVRSLTYRAEAPILSRTEAAEYVGKSERWGFDQWRKRFRVPDKGRGRYARADLDRGLRQEGRA